MSLRSSMSQQEALRKLISFLIVVFFLLIVFALGVGNEFSDHFNGLLGAGTISGVDFGQYVHLRTVSARELSLDAPKRRAIFLGDIHGMNQSLHAILDKVFYNPDRDTLIHVGDLAAKGTHSGSLSVLSYMAAHNITGVRGNHDQTIIEWRGWIDWIQRAKRGQGAKWLARANARWDKASAEEDDLDDEKWVAKERKAQRAEGKWWARVPKGWKMFSEHYQIARALSSAEYDYLRALPLVLHIPSQHAFVVHAGILPADPTKNIGSDRQPLAHAPDLAHLSGFRVALAGDRYRDDGSPKPSLPDLRRAQELAILNEIHQNNVPWNLLNMRNIAMDNTVTRKTKKGTFWADLWNGMMPLCKGFYTSGRDKEKRLPCHAASVIYGHTASRGLDVQRWTFGLDSGCVYGRTMSALVLDADSSATAAPRADIEFRAPDDAQDTEIKFGDNGQARIVSVKCHKHKDSKHRLEDEKDGRR